MKQNNAILRAYQHMDLPSLAQRCIELGYTPTIEDTIQLGDI